jgi:release factor glutamine methyltransferase
VIAAETRIAEALAEVAARLAAAGIDEAKLEARHLVAAALDVDFTALVLGAQHPLGDAAPRVQALLERRAAREPLSRILATREFFGLEFRLNAATLDPRPDSEALVEAVLERLDEQGRTEPLALLDLGTGTGALLLTLLSRLRTALGLGIDIADDAVAMARENAAALGLADRAGFQVGDLFVGLEGLARLSGKTATPRFDVIVSNPPYIPSGEIAGLDPEVRLHDPRLALDGGADGLDFYRRIAREAGAWLASGGILAVEVGAGQAGDVAAMIEAAGFTGLATRRDPGGIERVVIAETPKC